MKIRWFCLFCAIQAVSIPVMQQQFFTVLTVLTILTVFKQFFLIIYLIFRNNNLAIFYFMAK